MKMFHNLLFKFTLNDQKIENWSFNKAKLLEDGRFTAPVRIQNCKWPPKWEKSYFVICSAVFIALQIHCMYWPFTYEAKLTMMKETAHYTYKYIATKDKSKSGTLYV